MKVVQIYTGSACSRNPGGRGGWAYIGWIFDDVTERAGSVPAPTTSNRMALTAVIEALKTLQDQPCMIQLYSDNKYVVDGINRWRHGWREKGWITAAKTPVANLDLWQTIDDLTEEHKIQCFCEEGGFYFPDIERCNELAQQKTEYDS